MTPTTLTLCSYLIANKIAQAQLAKVDSLLIGVHWVTIEELKAALDDVNLEIARTMGNN